MLYFSTILLSIFTTVALIPLFGRLAVRYNVALDIPDARKVHGQPVPRVGGLAMALGVFGSVFLWMSNDAFLRAFLAGSAFIVLFGIIDDVRGLNFRLKFLSQLVPALVMVMYGGVKITHLGSLLPSDWVLPNMIAIPLTVIAIVGVTNAVNLADGLDGLAGGVCLLSFCCLAYLAYLDQNATLCLLALALGGSIFGFLRYNTYPAELFMGDTGSQFLGFSAITISLALTQSATALSPLVPLLVLGLPVIDTLAVMAQRLAERKPLFSPDKNHFHHKLIRLGLFHSESVLLIYILHALLMVTAFFFRFHSEWLLLTVFLVLSALVLLGFHHAESTGYAFSRYDFLDRIVKGRLARMRERGVFVKISFRIVEFGIPLLLFAACFAPAEIPPYLSYLCAAFLCILLFTATFKKTWMRSTLTAILYLLIPFIVWLSVGQEPAVEMSLSVRVYSAAFLALVFFVILTLKLTRRQRGFKTTPMDFLILFISLAVPHLIGRYLQLENLSVMAAKTVMFYFSFEVLIGELRGELNQLCLCVVPSLVLVITRGLLHL